MPILTTKHLSTPKQYVTLKLSDIYSNIEVFNADVATYYLEELDGVNSKQLYYLLMGEYAESHIAYTNIGQFKMQLFNSINRLYPTIVEYDKQQKELRKATMEDLLNAGETVTNAGASNTSNIETDAEAGSTQLGSQVVGKQKYGQFTAKLNKLKAMQYGLQQDLINDIRKHFIWLLEPQVDLFYLTSEDEQ